MMLVVTAYPILYAFWLSLFRADLRTPDQNQFIGLDNYVTVLSSPIWWQAFGFTMLITVVTTAVELALGMLLALVMHRTMVGRGLVRTSALVPYAIVTVVAAFSWRYAWTADRLPGYTVRRRAPLTERAVVLDHHAGGDLEDDAVHGTAADGRAGTGSRGPAQGGLDGRGDRLAAVLADDVPLMKPAILVALLFRTLDAFRVFDNIFVLTGGDNETTSVSMLAYNNLIRGLNLGIGSTMSVLIFVTVGDHRLRLRQAVRHRCPRQRRGEDGDGRGHHHAGEAALGRARRRGRALRARPGALDRLAVVQGPATLTDGKFWPRSGTLDNYRRSSTPTSSGPWSTRSASR